MNEILARLGALQFTVIGQGRSAASQKLIRDVAPSFRRWQGIDQTNDPDSIFEQPIFKIVALCRRLLRAPSK
jgi:hypothetical protein